ncbi:hypothetical protein U1Q18_028836 [Sarracenia purpurea var. burkii]
MRSSSSSFGSSCKKSNYGHVFDLPEDSREQRNYVTGGAMLPIFLNNLRMNDQQDLVEVTLELEDDSIVLCSVAPTSSPNPTGEEAEGGLLARSLSATSRICRKFSWLRSPSSRTQSEVDEPTVSLSTRDSRKMKAKLDRTRSSAQRALKGLRFISKTTGRSDTNELWKKVESRFETLARDGLLCREDFGECIGMVDSKEFAVGIFDALARRRRQRLGKITKEELHDFWLQISDQSFDARLQIFFDMYARLFLPLNSFLCRTDLLFLLDASLMPDVKGISGGRRLFSLFFFIFSLFFSLFPSQLKI